MASEYDHALEVCSKRGLSRVYVDVYLCAKPVFEKKGFRVILEKFVKIRDQELINFEMEFVEVGHL